MYSTQDLASTLLAADLDEHYGVPLDFISLLHHNPGLANTLLQSPQHMLDVLEDALIAAQASAFLMPASTVPWCVCSNVHHTHACTKCCPADNAPTMHFPLPSTISLQERVQHSHAQQQDMALKPNAHVRLYNLPYSLDPDASLLNPAICNLGSFHLGKLVTLRGTVVKAGPVKMFEAQKVYMCNKCKHR